MRALSSSLLSRAEQSDARKPVLRRTCGRSTSQPTASWKTACQKNECVGMGATRPLLSGRVTASPANAGVNSPSRPRHPTPSPLGQSVSEVSVEPGEDRKLARCPDRIGIDRNIVERLRARPKLWRVVATRCEEPAASVSCLGGLAAALDRLR